MKFPLKKGDMILVDFDGMIVDEDYPCIGIIKAKTYNFLEQCRIHDIKVLIWSARCNNNDKHSFSMPVCGSTSVLDIKLFLNKSGIYFTDVFIFPKPICEQFALYLLDDKVTDDPDRFEFV